MKYRGMTLIGLVLFLSSQTTFAISGNDIATSEREVCSIRIFPKISSKNTFEYLDECEKGDILYLTFKTASRAKNALRICEPDTLQIYDGGVKGHCIYTGTVLSHKGWDAD